jgi:hypothetical protein
MDRQEAIDRVRRLERMCRDSAYSLDCEGSPECSELARGDRADADAMLTLIESNGIDGPGHSALGMPLRDWFAGMTIMGVCQYGLGSLAVEIAERIDPRVDEVRSHVEGCSVLAYAVADAMLAEREKSHSTDWEQVATAHLRRIGELERERDELRKRLEQAAEAKEETC